MFNRLKQFGINMQEQEACKLSMRHARCTPTRYRIFALQVWVVVAVK